MGARRCKDVNCIKSSIYNIPGAKHGEYCNTHKLPGMVDVVNIKCCAEGCNIQPRYKCLDTNEKFCYKHSTDNMIKLYAKCCTEPNCKVVPSYGYINSKATKCLIHRLPDMVDLAHKRCIVESCTTRPSFGYTKNKALYCSQHKVEGTINVCTVTCLAEGCSKVNPTYNFSDNNQRGIYCKEHALGGMVDVMHKKCIHTGCKKRAGYNLIGMEPIYCLKHITSPQMINVTARRCIVEGCTHNKMYGLPDTPKTHCFLHKTPEMVCYNIKRCAEQGCSTIPTFDFPGNKGKWCTKHKPPGAIDSIHTMCQLCCLVRANTNLYKGYCMRCYMYTFPDNTIVKNYKTKERHVTDFIKEKFNALNITYDKTITGGKSLRRPDIFIDISNHVIVIEIDENQHDTYDCSCENKRLMELFIDAGSRNMTFIRFNPDDYININNKQVSSCWTLNDKGLCIIKDTVEWTSRLNILQETVDFIITHGNEKEINIIHLFYDGWI